MYKLVRFLLFYLDAEETHEKIVRLARYCSSSLPQKLLFMPYGGGDSKKLEGEVAGLIFPNPIGLAAGFDKNGYLVDVLAGFGFGFVEVGTITPRPQQGNPKPRVFRLPKDKALINRLGFNNEGADAIAERLKRRTSTILLGANIGKNKDTPNNKAAKDYETCFQKLHTCVDYIVVNVSSPNTPHLQELQDKKELTAILYRLQQINEYKKPIFLKIAPDLTETQLGAVVEAVKETGISGIIATNTLKQVHVKFGEGGLSGRPLFQKSNEVIRFLYERSEGEIPIIGVGGIFSGRDTYEKITAGASLIQVYTGLIYEGPGLVKSIKKDLAAFIKADGFTNITEAVGSKT